MALRIHQRRRLIQNKGKSVLPSKKPVLSQTKFTFSKPNVSEAKVNTLKPETDNTVTLDQEGDMPKKQKVLDQTKHKILSDISVLPKKAPTLKKGKGKKFEAKRSAVRARIDKEEGVLDEGKLDIVNVVEVFTGKNSNIGDKIEDFQDYEDENEYLIKSAIDEKRLHGLSQKQSRELRVITEQLEESGVDSNDIITVINSVMVDAFQKHLDKNNGDDTVANKTFHGAEYNDIIKKLKELKTRDLAAKRQKHSETNKFETPKGRQRKMKSKSSKKKKSSSKELIKRADEQLLTIDEGDDMFLESDLQIAKQQSQGFGSSKDQQKSSQETIERARKATQDVLKAQRPQSLPTDILNGVDGMNQKQLMERLKKINKLTNNANFKITTKGTVDELKKKIKDKVNAYNEAMKNPGKLLAVASGLPSSDDVNKTGKTGTYKTDLVSLTEMANKIEDELNLPRNTIGRASKEKGDDRLKAIRRNINKKLKEHQKVKQPTQGTGGLPSSSSMNKNEKPKVGTVSNPATIQTVNTGLGSSKTQT
jgi:hypothetical protein